MFGVANILEAFFAVVKRISVFVMALHTFRSACDEPVHELDALFTFVSVVTKRIPAATAFFSLPIVVMDLHPPP